MFVDGVTNADSMPTLEAMLRFSGQRQRLIQNNIANFSTPNYRPRDVSVAGFQHQLGEAVDRRRARFGGLRGNLDLRETREVKPGTRGELNLIPAESGRNILFHDRNNRDLERTMQDLAENVAAYRVAAELYRTQSNLIRTAITGR